MYPSMYPSDSPHLLLIPHYTGEEKSFPTVANSLSHARMKDDTIVFGEGDTHTNDT
jgi:hypothetical protein